MSRQENYNQKDARALAEHINRENQKAGIKSHTTITVEGNGVSYAPNKEKGNITEI